MTDKYRITHDDSELTLTYDPGGTVGKKSGKRSRSPGAKGIRTLFQVSNT